MKDEARLAGVIKQIRDVGVTDQTLEDVGALLREEALAPQEVDAIKRALAQAMSKTIAERQRRAKERESEKRQRRRRRAGRAVYVGAAAAILGGFLWINVVSARQVWGLSAVHIIALKCVPGDMRISALHQAGRPGKALYSGRSDEADASFLQPPRRRSSGADRSIRAGSDVLERRTVHTRRGGILPVYGPSSCRGLAPMG